MNSRAWGSYSHSSGYAQMHLSHLGVRFDALDRAEAGLLVHVASWRNYLLGWLPVLHGQLAEIIEVYDPVMWLEEEPDMAPTFFYEPNNPVALDTWRHAIYHASESDEVPLTLLLVYRAFKAWQEGDHRQAVVDAASAFELTLHATLKRAIDDSDRQGLGIADTILKSVTLGRMIGLANALGVWVPEDSSRRVVGTRNTTLHHGMPPDRRQTRALLHSTAQLMSHYEPTLNYTGLNCEHELPAYTRDVDC